MAPKLASHVRQLVGYGLVFAGLAAAAVAMFLATSFPAVPFWAFALVAVVVGAPLMVAGGRVNSVGRGQVLGMTPESAEKEYRAGTTLLAVYLAVLLLQGAWVAAPLFLSGVGLIPLDVPLVRVWVVVWVLVFCVGRYWITRPVVRAAARRLGR